MKHKKRYWGRERIQRRNKGLQKLCYQEWYRLHYEETADYALDYFFRILGECD